MSRKSRTEVVTFPARSFSSLEPGAAFCLSSVEIFSFACLTTWVAGPGGPASTGTAHNVSKITRRRFIWVCLPRTAVVRTIVTGVSFEGHHRDIPVEHGLRPGRAHLEPRDVGIGEVARLRRADRLVLEHRREPGPRRLLAGRGRGDLVARGGGVGERGLVVVGRAELRELGLR